MFPCEAEEVDEDEGGNSYEEEWSPARGHSLLHGEQAGAMRDAMAWTRSYASMKRSRMDVDVDAIANADNKQCPLMLKM